MSEQPPARARIRRSEVGFAIIAIRSDLYLLIVHFG